MDIGLVGGFLGGALGVAGGAVGTYFSIKNTSGPSERAFMIRVSIFTWVIVSAFVVELWLLPRPYSLLLWIPYGIALPLAIRWCNARQLQIRTQEAIMPQSASSQP